MTSHIDREFFKQIPTFTQQALSSLGRNSLQDLAELSNDLPAPLTPILIQDFRRITAEEKTSFEKLFYGREGVAAFALTEPDHAVEHPMLTVARQLADVLPLRYPVRHPAEADKYAEGILGKSEGTLKVFQRPDQENSLESKELHMHQDGIGLAGSVATVGLYCESGPLWGGLTCFQNVLRLAVELARVDAEAFEMLFLPTALTITRRMGRKALRVTGPVLYLNAFSQPQVFLRAPGGDYEMVWAEGPAITRARKFLESHVRPFAIGSRFLPLSVKGQGCFVRNSIVLHGRTKFFDYGSRKRVLARKWFGFTAEDSEIRQVPGLRILNSYAALRPDLFGEDVLNGQWRYDANTGSNLLV